MPYGLMSVAATAVAQAVHIPTSGPALSPRRHAVHVFAAHHNPNVPHPTSQPPWVLAQKIISGGTSHSTRVLRSARRSSSTRTEKQSTEKSCGRTCCARVRIPTSPRAVSTTAVRASAPSSFAILHTHAIDRRMTASLSSTRPLEPAILNAAAIKISDSHSWLIHGLSDVKE